MAPVDQAFGGVMFINTLDASRAYIYVEGNTFLENHALAPKVVRPILSRALS